MLDPSWLRAEVRHLYAADGAVCLADPDATMTTNARNQRLEPAYKQHTAVDDMFGAVLDVEVTTGQANEGGHVLAG